MKMFWILSNAFSVTSAEMLMWLVYFSSLLGNTRLEIQTLVFQGLIKRVTVLQLPP